MDSTGMGMFFGGAAAALAAVWTFAQYQQTGGTAMDIDTEQEHQTPKRVRLTREQAALGQTSHEKRYEGNTLTYNGEGCYLSAGAPKTREDGSVQWRMRRDRGLKAADATWEAHRKWAEENVYICSRTGNIASIELADIGWDADLEIESSSSSSSSSSSAPQLEESRRHAVRFLYVQDYGRLPEEKWANFYGPLSLPGVICRRLNISANSLAEVKKVMLAIYQEEEVDGGMYTAGRTKGGGRQR